MIRRLLRSLGLEAGEGDPSEAAGEDGLTGRQREILRILRETCGDGPDRAVAYECEWMGHFPNPLVHGVKAAGQPLERTLPKDWGASDLDALARAGHLRKVREENRDEYDLTIVYELAPPP